MNLSQISQLAALKAHLDKFRANHPKFPQFMEAAYKNALEEGSVIEISITAPEGEHYVTNLRVTKDDLEFLQTLQTLHQ